MFKVFGYGHKEKIIISYADGSTIKVTIEGKNKSAIKYISNKIKNMFNNKTVEEVVYNRPMTKEEQDFFEKSAKDMEEQLKIFENLFKGK